MRYTVVARAIVAALSAAALTSVPAAAADRVAEQVSPAAKGGNEVFPGSAPLSSIAGDRLFFASTGAIVDTASGPLNRGFLATRGADWATIATDGPLAPTDFAINGTLGVSDDGTKALIVGLAALTPDATAGNSNLYLRDLTQPDALRLVVSIPGRAFYDTAASQPGRLVAATADMSTIAFTTAGQILPDGPSDPQDGGEYLYLSNGGRITLASRLPDGTPQTISAYFFSPSALQRVLSADGRSIVWTPTSQETTYRTTLTDGGATVADVIRSRRPGTTTEPFTFRPPSSSADGGQTFFVSDQPLTADSVGPDADGVQTQAIYRYTSAGDRLDDLTAPIVRAEEGGELRIRAVTPDGALVWFTSPAALTPGAASGRQHLYLLDAGTKTVRFVAQAQIEETVDRLRFSPDGRRVLIKAYEALTGADNANTACAFTGAEGSDGRCAELFTWDARQPDSQSLVCVSCKAGRSEGGADFGSYPISLAGRESRAITDDGRVFFDTPSRIVAADTDAATDVYEFTPGRGAALMTAGNSGRTARFADAGVDGRDLFVLTDQRLVAQDVDDLKDVYDLRVGGGIASQQRTPPPAAQPCDGEDCLPAPTARPAEVAPASSTLQRSTAKAPSFTVAKPSRKALRAAARTGRLAVAVKVTAPGKLSASLRNRDRTVAQATRKATKAQTVRLVLRLSKAARARLRRTGTLSVRLTVAYSERLDRYRTTLTIQKGGAR